MLLIVMRCPLLSLAALTLLFLATPVGTSPSCAQPRAVREANEVVSSKPQLVINARGLNGDAVACVDISSDGKLVAAATGKEVRVWSIADKRLYATLRGYREPGGFHVGAINLVKFIPGTQHLAVAVSDNTTQGSTRIYDLANPDELFDLLPGHVGCTKGIAVTQDGNYLITYGCDRKFNTYQKNATTNRWALIKTQNWMTSSKIRRALTTFDLIDETRRGSFSYFGFPGDDTTFLARHFGYIINTGVRVGFDPRNRTRNWLVYDAGTQEARGGLSQWPSEIKNLRLRLAGVGNPLDAPDWRYETKTLDFKTSGDPWYVSAGIARRNVPEKQTDYWAASYSPQASGQPATYLGHRFAPSAIAAWQGDGNSSRALVASGDGLGEVHVWKAQNAERVSRFKPKNWQLYDVEWESRSNAIRFSTIPYAGKDYTYNHYGPITHKFAMDSRTIAIANTEPDASNQIPAKKAAVVEVSGQGKTYQVSATEQGLCCYRKGQWKSLSPWIDMEKATDRITAPRRIDTAHFGKVYCFAAVPSERGPPRVVVGSEKGGLEEYALVTPGPSDRVLMACTRKFIGHSGRVTSISFRDDGNAMASCSWDGTIRLWSLKQKPTNGDVDFWADGTSVRNVPATSRAARAGIKYGDVITHFDGKPFFERFQQMSKGMYQPGQRVPLRGVFGGSQGTRTITLTDAPSYVEPYLTVFLSNNQEWIAFTPKGYYDASAEGEQYVGWHINQERHEPGLFYGVDQFRSQLYRPDVIDAVLSTRDESLALELANANLARPAEAYPSVAAVPTIEILSPRSPYNAGKGSLTLFLRSTAPEGDTIEHVEVRVDDRVSLKSVNEVSSQTKNGVVETTYRTEVLVPSGSSVVSAAAYAKTVKSSTATIDVIRDQSNEASELPNLYILSIGISKFANKAFNLKWAHQDATDFAAAWKAQEEQAYAAVESHVLTNEQATVKNIREGMAWLEEKTANHPYDVAMIFIAGHGVFNNRGSWYFGGYELDPKRLRTTAVPQREFSGLLSGDLGCRVLLFADTCHAGAVEESGIQLRHPQRKDAWQSVEGMSFVSCGARQMSWEHENWKNGAFTEAILRALRDQRTDSDPDGRITFDELQVYVKGETRRLVKSIGHAQNPASRTTKHTSEVFLAIAPE